MGRKSSLRSKAAHFMSDVATVILNPISDKPSKSPTQLHSSEDYDDSEAPRLTSIKDEKGSHPGPDTSSFSAFLYSLLSSPESGSTTNADKKDDGGLKGGEEVGDSVKKEGSVSGKRSLISKGKQSVGKIVSQATYYTGFKSQKRERKGSGSMKYEDDGEPRLKGVEIKNSQMETDLVLVGELPASSEMSMLLSEKTRCTLYASLPALVQGRKWVLLYSTWRHGTSLSTLYRQSMLWPGLSLLVVGDRQGAVFGGLVEAPLRPSSTKRYQGSNNMFVFTNTLGHPLIYRPTGVNRYFAVCGLDYLAFGGGGHFALYLDGDLLNGSSRFSETFGNPCLAQTEDFEVKEVELWGFVYASKYDEVSNESVRSHWYVSVVKSIVLTFFLEASSLTRAYSVHSCMYPKACFGKQISYFIVQRTSNQFPVLKSEQFYSE